MKYEIIKADSLTNLKRFKKFGGDTIADIGQYVAEYVSKNKGTQVSIGCDSQQMRKSTCYAVAIVFYNPSMRSGAHIVFAREHVKKIKDTFTRLYGEVEVAHYIADIVNTALESVSYEKVYYRYNPNGMKYGDIMIAYEPTDKEKYYRLADVHFDFNPDPGVNGKNRSHMLHDIGKGMMEGIGYRTYTKPFAFAASCAADLIAK